MDGSSLSRSFTVPDNASGTRLDALLASALPHLGVRARRRLWQWCRITVNGIQRKPGYMPSPGDCIAITPLNAAGQTSENDAPGGVALISLTALFAALYKPAGMHSAVIAGGGEGSLESLLPAIWPSLLRGYGITAGTSAPPEPPLLLTRLDRPTSGLLIAARNEDAAARFRRWEKEGLVEKTYFALITGRLEGPLYVDRALDTANRSVTRVLDAKEQDATRHTVVRPLLYADPPHVAGGTVLPRRDAPFTLASVRIQRGARHQIRAHLAFAGYPLYKDTLYGAEAGGTSSAFFLHHAAIAMPEFSAERPPDWLAGVEMP